MKSEKLKGKNQKRPNTSDGGRLNPERSRGRSHDSSEVDVIKKETITRELKEIIDPELGVNIVDLGLIYGVKIDNGNVTVIMTLTTPGCPMGYMFDTEVVKAVKKVKGVKKVKVELTFDPPWTPEKMSKETRQKIRY